MAQQLILNSCPDLMTAEQLARQVIKKNLAACVNMASSLSSVYRW